MDKKIPALSLQLDKQRLSQPFQGEFTEKVLQVGDGNFIRGFIDWMIDEMNRKTGFNGSIVSIQATPRGKGVAKLSRQDGLFTLLLRGVEDGAIVDKRQVIHAISRGINPYTNWYDVLKTAEAHEIEFLFSNTTEAGLRYEREEYVADKAPLSFPGKVVALLYHRYVHFVGQQDKGWIVIPCELIENNGDTLKDICLKIIGDWELPSAFTHWLLETCTFCNTLVDRIVPGYPKNEDEALCKQFGYTDELLTVAEPYHLFVIEGPSFVEEKLPFKEAGLNVHFDSIESYRELKIKLLNAPHTMLASIGLLSGIESVGEGIKDPLLSTFIHNTLNEEICATFHPAEKEKAIPYIEQVFDRFANPYLHHRLADISLNSFAKFQTRVWPSIYAYRSRFGENPKRLVFAFASLLHFFTGIRSDKSYQINDDPHVLSKFQLFYADFSGSEEALIKFIENIIQEDFLQVYENIGDLPAAIAKDFLLIQELGIQSALEKLENGR